MTEQTHEKLKQIKQSFRLLMNGVASQSMREKGVTYKINWGVPLTELRRMAEEYGKDYDLAIELWKEDIRECQILATLIMPAERMEADLVEVWMERLRTQEMAELLAFNLLQHLDFAPALAYQWIASDRDMYQLCGYQLLSRLFASGKEPNERGINEFLDQAHVTLMGTNLPLRHAAFNCVLSFCDLGADFEAIAQKALADLNLL
ncbi:MAG: DNA alkylation repair protein [Prevotella sp.]|nr:DNA alkylation repair protein [Prevotella sp.]